VLAARAGVLRLRIMMVKIWGACAPRIYKFLEKTNLYEYRHLRTIPQICAFAYDSKKKPVQKGGGLAPPGEIILLVL